MSLPDVHRKVIEKTLETEEKLFCLGDIVHNDMEVDRLEKMGLIIVNNDDG